MGNATDKPELPARPYPTSPELEARRQEFVNDLIGISMADYRVLPMLIEAAGAKFDEKVLHAKAALTPPAS